MVITVYSDKSFTFITKTPPAAVLIKKALGLEKGSAVPNKDKVGTLTQDQLRAIAEQKMPDLNANDIEAAMKIIAGTARSMGVTGGGAEAMKHGKKYLAAAAKATTASRSRAGAGRGAW